MALKKIGEKDFDRFTFENDMPSLVLCREQIPIVERVAYEYRGRIEAYWVDVDKHDELFYRFRLQGIPNIVIFNDEEIVKKIRGLNSK